MADTGFTLIKIGTKVVTDNDGFLDLQSLQNIVDQIAHSKQKVALVSSGAVSAGKSIMQKVVDVPNISKKQLYSAVGQAELINQYSRLFGRYNMHVAQVLVTREDFRDRSHFSNIKNCLETLFHDNVIPIINENDVTAIEELGFTDNDELAGIVASQLHADKLIILSSIDGLLDSTGNLITEIIPSERKKYLIHITPDKSEAGRGGMTTKYNVAARSAREGIDTYIANGKSSHIISDILGGKTAGTHFKPEKKKISNTKRRLSHARNFHTGSVTIDDGALASLKDETKISSLLLVGVKKLSGDFLRGDVISIHDQKGREIGYGISQYSFQDAEGKRGQRGIRPLIHYDYLYILD